MAYRKELFPRGYASALVSACNSKGLRRSLEQINVDFCAKPSFEPFEAVELRSDEF